MSYRVRLLTCSRILEISMAHTRCTGPVRIKETASQEEIWSRAQRMVQGEIPVKCSIAAFAPNAVSHVLPLSPNGIYREAFQYPITVIY